MWIEPVCLQIFDYHLWRKAPRWLIGCRYNVTLFLKIIRFTRQRELGCSDLHEQGSDCLSWPSAANTINNRHNMKQILCISYPLIKISKSQDRHNLIEIKTVWESVEPFPLPCLFWNWFFLSLIIGRLRHQNLWRIVFGQPIIAVIQYSIDIQ